MIRPGLVARILLAQSLLFQVGTVQAAVAGINRFNFKPGLAATRPDAQLVRREQARLTEITRDRQALLAKSQGGVLRGAGARTERKLAAPGPQDWPGYGGTPSSMPDNTRWADTETLISPASAGQLQQIWSATVCGDVQANPSVVGDQVYVTDDGDANGGNGCITTLNAASGAIVWQNPLSFYTQINGDYARGTPAVFGNDIIVASRIAPVVVAINRASGVLDWMNTSIDAGVLTEMITAAPSIVTDAQGASHVIVATSSGQEWADYIIANFALSFRGSLVSLNAQTGVLEWQSYMVPPGYTGAAIWGSGTPRSTDPRTGATTIYAATGNDYAVPAAVAACEASGGNKALALACTDPADNVDAMVAVDLATGRQIWSHRFTADNYTTKCSRAAVSDACEQPALDYDFGFGPIMLPSGVVGAGQKNGYFVGLSPDAGKLAALTNTGGANYAGGMMWGGAADGRLAYMNNANGSKKPVVLTRPPPGTLTRTSGGYWSAVGNVRGGVVWQAASLDANGAPVSAQAPMTVANDVVFGGNDGGMMVAMNAANGAKLWSFYTGGASVFDGPAVSNGCLYWGTGGESKMTGNQVLAFCVPGGGPPGTQLRPAR